MPLHTSQLIIGVSACLVGEAVRYDGGHKFHPRVAEQLAAHARLVPFCPELMAGLGVPRPPVRLIASTQGQRAVGVENPDLDVTAALRQSAEGYCNRLDELSLTGFILKSRSPSCGRGSTPIHDADGATVLGYGDGLFAEQLRSTAPWLPCIEEEWLISDQRCWRFLTACVLVAARYGRPIHTELVKQLTERTRLGHEEWCDILLEEAELPELDELLEQYWSSR